MNLYGVDLDLFQKKIFYRFLVGGLGERESCLGKRVEGLEVWEYGILGRKREIIVLVGILDLEVIWFLLVN